MRANGPEVHNLGASSIRELVSAAAMARSDRAARLSMNLLEDHLLGGDVHVALPRLRALRLFGELASMPIDDPGRLASVLDRLCSAHLMASPVISLLRTSVDGVRMDGPLAGLVLAVTADLLLAATSAVGGDDGAELSFRAYDENGWIMLVVETSGDARDVLPTEGTAALHRVRAAAAVIGGVVRRRCDGGRLGIAFTVELARSALGQRSSGEGAR